MLQKGFLKPCETEENARTLKRSRMFFFVGIFAILSGFLVFMIRMKQEQEEISIVWLVLLIAGFFLISVSMWMNFFAQKKKRRR